jgi:hypothetical protein
VHSADGWRALLEPVITHCRGIVKRHYCRGDAAFANPEMYEFLEAEGVGYTIRPAFAARAAYKISGVFKETGSGAKLDRAERKKVIALAQRREIDAVLVIELSRWGRCTLDLLHTRSGSLRRGACRSSR